MGRPCFGPKRIGIGLRPQTWQGWVVTVVVLAVLVVILRLVVH
jgi:hypothetical protein